MSYNLKYNEHTFEVRVKIIWQNNYSLMLFKMDSTILFYLILYLRIKVRHTLFHKLRLILYTEK